MTGLASWAWLWLAIGVEIPMPVESPCFVRLATRPSPAELVAANQDPRDWTLRMQDGLLTATAEPVPRQDPLSFPVPPHADRAGDRHVLPISEGWLVGFDAGEFGGGLWLTRDGSEWRRIVPPRHDTERTAIDNVHGIAELQGRIHILAGLDHLDLRQGVIFEVITTEGSLRLRPVSSLDASPETWAVTGESLDVVTRSGLWRMADGQEARRIVALPLDGLYPSSLVTDGARRFIGMRRYVVELLQGPSGWDETWYEPSTGLDRAPRREPDSFGRDGAERK